MRNFLLILSVLTLLGCGSRDENPNDGSNADGTSKNADTADLNHFVSGTLFDSLLVKSLPYTDSICMETFLPVHKSALTSGQIRFLQLKELRVFREFERPLPDSAFNAVCRLKLSPSFYTIVVNFNGENETMNYLINYDRRFQVIDYLESSYDELVESALRMTSVIDTASVQVHFSDLLHAPESHNEYVYHLSPDGYFRERLAGK